MGCHTVLWHGAPTQWADACQEKQRSQRARALLNRLPSVLTYWVMAGGQENLTRHAASESMESGQLLNLALIEE